ncbi:MAG TPA: hypothetical protein VGT03_11590 [Candidatus Acidoferrales bacterium]|nr:hypothetical protein [Candidatus Acidoferrales bacterium]
MISRAVLSLSLFALLAGPLWAGTGVVGTVQTSRLATLHGANLVSGTTVWDGDSIAVALGGSAWVSVPVGSAIVVGQNSEIQFRKPAESVVEFELDSGQVEFRPSDASTLRAILGDATVQSLKGAAIGYITMFGPSSAIIGAKKGDILITVAHDGSSRTIHEGSAISVRLAPDPQQENNNVVPAMRSKHRILIWGAAIIGGTTIVGILLNDDEKKVSPSNFNP